MIIPCPHCGQEISAEDISGKFACPHCGGHIQLAKEQPPVVEHSVGAPPPIAHHSQPPSKSRIFYYVFWGTISLLGTLALLVVGFSFFGAASDKFINTALDARNASPHKRKNIVEVTEVVATRDEITGVLKNVSEAKGDFRIHFGLFDATDAKLTDVRDRVYGLEPGETWRFKANLFGRRFATYRFEGVWFEGREIPASFEFKSDK